jgi:hypothetical protein
MSTRNGKTGRGMATHLTDGATRHGAAPKRSATMNPLLSNLVRRLRPSPERFAAAAALYDNTPLLQLRAANVTTSPPR